MDYENVTPNQSIGDWYNLFNGNNVADGQQVQETKPAANNALGELLIYSAKARAYAEFITGAVNMIEQDVKRDIQDDIRPNLDPAVTMGAIPTSATMPKPLAMAVANREKLVECSEKLAEVVKAIDSILARVRIKEQQ